MLFLHTPEYGTTYSEQNPFVNKNSIYETKTIIGHLISENKTAIRSGLDSLGLTSLTSEALLSAMTWLAVHKTRSQLSE